MVYSKPHPTSGAMKRSASALETPGWDIAPPMMTHSRSSFRPPYAHYSMIYLDHDGKIKVDESTSIQEQNTTVFTPDVRQSFLEVLGERIGYHAPHKTINTSPRRVRRRKGNAPAFAGSDDRLTEHGSDSEDASNGSEEMVPLRIGDSLKVQHYYESALKHFQQLNCRMVAKAFIKFIEPRKQVRHPYNGGKAPPGSAPGATGDPEKTKPEWWPPGVMHKEPDHLRKEFRIELLIHIIRKLSAYGITADKLKEVAGDTKRSLKHSSHVEIIYEILRVRKMEERFERGEVDSNMVVYTMNRGPSPKEGEEDDSADAPSVTIDEPDHNQGLMTPMSAVDHQVAAALTTPVDNLPSARSLPGSFSMPEPLSFETTTRQDRSYYGTPPQYTDSFSQPMLSTPVTAEMIAPHDISVFDYSSHNSFTSSTPDHQRGAGHYDPWTTPSIRQNMFGSVEYAPATSQPMSQPSMGYPMPMSSHMHDMSHHGSIDQRSLPFRTGSLSHPYPSGLPLTHHA